MRRRTSGIFLLLTTLALPAVAFAGSADETIDAMIAAHGGMEKWAAAPTVSFEDEFKPAEAESGAASRVTVEQGPRRAYIDFPGTEMRMSWDGMKAWSENWQMPFPPRFLALLNYYFVNLPWLAKDPGVILTDAGTGTLVDDPTQYRVIKMTYESGVGDTPDDYYTLYIHPETHRLRACKYIVTYRALLPEGVDATPENTLIFDEFATVDELVVPTHYTIYRGDGAVYATNEIRDWSFRRPFDESRMVMPDGAVVDESAP